MRTLTYLDICIEEGILRCTDCWDGSPCQESIDKHNDPGNWANISSGMMHWRNRKVTKPGLRNFLKLWASILRSHNRGQATWQKLHEQNVTAYHIARRHGVILPKRLSRNDRLLAAASMHDVTPKPQPAYQWAMEDVS